MTMETVVNKYHVSVEKCCASCRHKEVDNDGKRICTKMRLKVTQQFVCHMWQMSEGLRNAGMSGGVIKKLTDIVIQ